MKLQERMALDERLKKETEARLEAIRRAGDASPFMSRKELARYFSVDETTVRRNRGIFAGIRRTKEQGKYLYVRADAVAAKEALMRKAYAPDEITNARLQAVEKRKAAA